VARVLVTGGAGYIGSHTCRALRAAGHEPVVLDDLSSGHAAAVRGLPLAEGDVADPEVLASTFDRSGPFDAVVHFAARISVPESVSDPLGYYRANTAAALTLVEAAVARGVGAFVLSSTAAVYGHPREQPIGEDAPLAPTSPYGASKAMVERILADASRAHGLRYAALRYFNAAGADPAGDLGEEHDPETHLIPLALAAAAGRRPPLELFGTDYPTPDGTCVRDYVHVCDLARAHCLAVEALVAGEPGGVFNLGTGRGHSNREVLGVVEEIVGRPVPAVEAPRRPGDPPELVADPRRFRERFGWEPGLSELRTIVETAWRFARSRWADGGAAPGAPTGA